MQLDEQVASLLSKYSNAISNAATSNAKLNEVMTTPEEWQGKTSTLIVTDECNLRCSYCYIRDKAPNVMSWEVAKDFIDLIFENNQHLANIPVEEQNQFNHGKIWDFIGGEPFLEYSLVFDCMDYIIDKTNKLPDPHPWKQGFNCVLCERKGFLHKIPGFRFQFSTNGTLLSNPEIRKKLEQYGEELVSLSITIDGPKDMHDLCRVYENGSGGTFDDIMKNRSWHLKHFPNCGSSTKSTIAHENLPYVSKVAKFFWEELNIPYVMMNCVFENVWHQGDQLILFDQLCDLADYLIIDERYKRLGIRWFSLQHGKQDTSDKKWCGAGTHMDACAWDGTLYPCLRFKSLDNLPPYPIGDIKSGKDKKILEMFDVVNCHTDNIQKEVTGVDCASCTISSLCASCQAYSYDVYGRLDVKAVFICPMHKATVFANVYFFGRLLDVLKKEDRDYLLLLLDQFTKDDYFGYDSTGNPVPLKYKKES